MPHPGGPGWTHVCVGLGLLLCCCWCVYTHVCVGVGGLIPCKKHLVGTFSLQAAPPPLEEDHWRGLESPGQGDGVLRANGRPRGPGTGTQHLENHLCHLLPLNHLGLRVL